MKNEKKIEKAIFATVSKKLRDIMEDHRKGKSTLRDIAKRIAERAERSSL